MYKKIAIQLLKPGMFIVDSGINWLDEPYLYSDNIEATESLIRKIISEGFLEVFVDPDRSVPGTDISGLAGDAAAFQKAAADAAPDGGGNTYVPPKVAILEEMPAAKKIYVEALELSKLFMDGIRRGENVDLRKAKPLVDEMIKSLDRNPDALMALCKLRARDDYTYAHSVNVSVLGLMFAKHMGFSREQQMQTGMAGIFHDLGKALIPLNVLNAPRSLSEEEFALLRKHPRLGYEQIKKTPGFSQEILMGVYDHHERFNGGGYPRGVAGDVISLTGRVLGIADVYDALSSTRSYKEAVLPHRVLGIMYQMRSEDFFPGYMEHFIRMLGIYPVGSVVELQDGKIGVVSGSNKTTPTKPKVLITRDSEGKLLPPYEVDTSIGQCTPVQRCLTALESPINPSKVLGVY
jgi:HD-GYP domain-containing protein (c-di-GMP phosphodiesterase class II)